MKENLRPFGYLDEYIDMLDVSAETKGEIREKLIDNIQKNNKIQLEQERLEGYMEAEIGRVLEFYENEIPKGLSYDPKDLELLRKISARIRKREEILRRFENE